MPHPGSHRALAMGALPTAVLAAAFAGCHGPGFMRPQRGRNQPDMSRQVYETVARIIDPTPRMVRDGGEGIRLWQLRRPRGRSRDPRCQRRPVGRGAGGDRAFARGARKDHASLVHGTSSLCVRLCAGRSSTTLARYIRRDEPPRPRTYGLAYLLLVRRSSVTSALIDSARSIRRTQRDGTART